MSRYWGSPTNNLGALVQSFASALCPIFDSLSNDTNANVEIGSFLLELEGADTAGDGSADDCELHHSDGVGN